MRIDHSGLDALVTGKLTRHRNQDYKKYSWCKAATHCRQQIYLFAFANKFWCVTQIFCAWILDDCKMFVEKSIHESVALGASPNGREAGLCKQELSTCLKRWAAVITLVCAIGYMPRKQGLYNSENSLRDGAK